MHAYIYVFHMLSLSATATYVTIQRVCVHPTFQMLNRVSVVEDIADIRMKHSSWVQPF